MKEIIKKIEYNKGTFPKNEIEELIKRKDEAVPVLLDIIKKVRDNPKKFINNSNYFAHIYAVYLLAQFRSSELFPLFIDILNFQGEMPHDLFGDVICEAAGRIIASVYSGDIQTIKDLIENEKVDEYVRGHGLRALAILALYGTLDRKEVLDYYKGLLNGGLKDQHPYVLGEVVVYADDLYPEELYNDIKKAFEEDKIDESVIGMKSIDYTLKESRNKVLKDTKDNIHMRLIDNTIEEMEYWYCFYIDYEKRKSKRINEYRMRDSYEKVNTEIISNKLNIGRNDPCPCGSGKKYKKCCLK